MTAQKQDLDIHQLANKLISHMPGHMDQYMCKTKMEATPQVEDMKQYTIIA